MLWLAFVINYVDRQVVFSIFPALTRDLGFNNAQLGLIGTIFIWIYSVCNPLVGRISDVYSRPRLIAISIVLWSLATLGTGFATSVAMFLLLRAVMGITEALYVPPALGVIGTLHSGATRSRALALHGTAQFAGIVIGSSFGGYMADTAGWRAAFFILAGVGLLYAPVLWLRLKHLDTRTSFTGAQAQAGESPYRSMAGNACYLALSLAFFALCIILWMIYAWLPTHLGETMGLSMSRAGVEAAFWVQTGNLTGNLVGGALGDALSRRWPVARFALVCAGLACCAPLAYFAIASTSLAAFKLFACGFGLTAGLMTGNHFAASYDITAPSNYGIGAGTLNMIGGISGGAAIFVAGHLKDTLGIRGLMGWSAAFAVASAVILAITVSLRFSKDRWVAPAVEVR
jgi:MFS family permease